MVRSEPGPAGSGSEPSADELRRRLYRPDTTEADRIAYLRLLAEREAVTAPPVEEVGHEEVGADVETADPDRPKRRTVPIRAAALAVIAVACAALVVAALLPPGDPPLPRTLTPPPAAGASLAVLSREADPRVGAGTTTYQPQGYTVFQPSGGVTRVVLRCQGVGSVTVNAGRVFRFRCTGRLRLLRQELPTSATPFVISGITKGDVVWAASVSAA